MFIIDGMVIGLALISAFYVFLKLSRKIKYELKDNSLEIKKRKLQHLYHSIHNA